MKYGYIKGLDKKVSRIIQGTLGVDEIVDCLNEHKDAGRIRMLGVSN